MRNFVIIIFLITAESILAGEIFDDFNYSNSKFPVDGDSSFSLYGINPWITEDSVIHSRAWHRFNADGHKFSDYSDVTAHDSIVKLTFKKGFDNSLHRGPIFVSGFLLDHGTFAARIKLSALHDQKMIQAFWLTSTVHLLFNREGEIIRNWDEMDFEWNNYFLPGDGFRENMTIGCNNEDGKYIRNTTYDFIVETGDSKSLITKGGTSMNGVDYFHDKWYVCFFVLDSINRKVSIYMCDDDPSLNADVYAVSGNNGQISRGFVIDNYYPVFPMTTDFSMHADKIKKDVDFYADWFYYSEDLIYDGKQILKNVSQLKTKNINRLNTTGISLLHPSKDTASVVFDIAGPDSVNQNENPQYSITTNFHLWGAFEVSFEYRFISGGHPGDWIGIYHRDIELEIPNFADEIELKLTLFEYWNDFRDTVYHKTKIIKKETYNPEKFEVWISPNPAISSFQLILDVYEESNFEINLHDLNGSKLKSIVKDFIKRGRFNFNINLSDFANGHYFLIIKSENRVLTKKLIKLQN